MRAKVQHEWTREVNHRWRGDGDASGGGGEARPRPRTSTPGCYQR